VEWAPQPPVGYPPYEPGPGCYAPQAYAPVFVPPPPKNDCLPCFWASVEYLLWWVKNDPTPPLVTSNPDIATIAALNEAGTSVLLGGPGGGIEYDRLSGGRVTMGGWFGVDQIAGLEGSLFLLQQGSFSAYFRQNEAVGPVLGVPFNATVPFGTNPGGGFINPAGETTFNSGGAPLDLTVTGHVRLWGGDLNSLLNLWTDRRCRLHLLFGVRYLDLEEDLGILAVSPDPLTNGAVTVKDLFATHNRFVGGQFGARAGITKGKCSLDIMGKCAFGLMGQLYNVSGSTTVINGAFGLPNGNFPGGIFAQSSNIGEFEHNAFAIVPEGQLKFTYRFCDRVHMFATYDVLYVSNVLRPGTQIDRNVNPTQNPILSQQAVPAGALAPPGAVFNRTDFWAQGVGVGFEFRY
jgi:hypothetical protein